MNKNTLAGPATQGKTIKELGITPSKHDEVFEAEAKTLANHGGKYGWTEYNTRTIAYQGKTYDIVIDESKLTKEEYQERCQMEDEYNRTGNPAFLE